MNAKNELLILRDLISEGTQKVNKAIEDANHQMDQDRQGINKSFDEMWKRVSPLIPSQLRPFLVVNDEDRKTLVIKGKVDGLKFKFDQLLPIYLRVSFIKMQGQDQESVNIEYSVPPITLGALGYGAAAQGEGGSVDGCIWLFTDNPAIALHHARLRYLRMVELQNVWDEEQKKPKYVKVEETQGQPDPYQQLTQAVSAVIDARVMQLMLEKAG